jgi:hypothetical protein
VLDSENSSEFTTFVENYGESLSEYFGRLLILYDPVSTKAYEKVGVDVKAPIQTSIEKTVNNLMDVVNAVSSEATKPLTLIVIPSDIYNALSNDMRAKLESHSLDVSQALSDREFLAGLIREYTRTRDKPNGCELSNDVLSKLAGELAEFDSGHALIARLVGEELARNNCNVGEVKELINNAKGKAEAFIILHINGLFKVHENPDTAKALVEIFALRKPFIDEVKPGDPILTPGIVELIGEKKGASLLQSAEGEELRSWLAIRQHDLIEDSIGELLRCIVNESKECKEKLGTTLKPWRLRTVRKSLREISEKVRDEVSAVDYFVSSYGEKLTEALKDSSNCWRRATLIIGHALAGHVSVPRPEDLPNDVVESLGDVLGKCGVDDYLLVGDKIPLLLIWYLTYTRALAEAFVDEYNEAVAEVRRVLNIVRGRGGISPAEGFYGLGLSSIIAKAVESGKPIKSGDADAALRLASFAMRFIASTDYVEPILRTLEPLHDETPHRYLGLLAFASDIENLNPNTVKYIFGKLNYVLNNYGDRVKEYAWSLVHAIDAYSNLLRRYLNYFKGEIAYIVDKVTDLLNKLSNAESYVSVIAWAFILTPALIHEDVRRLIEGKLHSDVVSKANEILTRLDELKRKIERESIEELRNSDKDFVNYVESKSVGASKETVREEVLDTALFLSHELAIYRLHNDELDEAAKLFNKVAKGYREIGNYENYLVDRGWILRVKAIKNLLVSDELAKLANGFKQLYKKTFSKEHLKPTASYLSNASSTLGEYLVSLALMNNIKKIDKLLKKHWNILNFNKEVSVLTRLTLNVLLNPKSELSSELKGKLTIQPAELFMAFKDKMRNEVMTIMSDRDAIERLRGELIRNLHGLGLVKGLNTEINEFIINLINKLNDESLVQLIAPISSRARLALMLYALINNNVELAKAHAALGAMEIPNKLPTRLFLEAYRACCDLKNSEEFRRAIAKLFFLHV